MQVSKPVHERIMGLPQLLQWDYLNYTVNDSRNFGFLGRFRLDQFLVLGDLFPKHFLFGVGFEKVVVDFHGLYFCLLGATGLAGLLLFAVFVRQMIRRLLEAVLISSKNVHLHVAALCSLVTWLICSLTESYFVQFSAWVVVLIALVIIAKNSPSFRHEAA
jgi:hypothetical protein